MNKKYRYSEIFRSIQGEGNYTGRPTIWYRAWGCNFNCNGFGQKDPSDSSTWILPYEHIDVGNIKRIEDLPVFEFGCDSSYSWAKKFSHLAHHETVEKICAKLRSFLPNGKFTSDAIDGQKWHMAFTGGEPMMSQSAISDIMRHFKYEGDIPLYVTVETNGTQQVRDNFIDVFTNKGLFDGELFWSCSPKLSASGESWNRAINPKVLAAYNTISKNGQLKYVVDGTEKCWDEVKRATELYREAGVKWPVWIMPVGATLEEQEDIQAKIADQALDRGYNVSARLHCWIWGNKIGT